MTKMSKMAKARNKYGIVFPTQLNSQKSTQNPFYDGESFARMAFKWKTDGE